VSADGAFNHFAHSRISFAAALPGGQGNGQGGPPPVIRPSRPPGLV